MKFILKTLLISILISIGLHAQFLRHKFSSKKVNEKNVSLLGRWAAGLCNAVYISGQYCYTANGAAMDILDITDPAEPVLKGKAIVPTVIREIFVIGNYAYIADDVGGLRIVNVEYPSAPYEVGSFASANQANSIFVDGNYAYVADRLNGLRILDVTNPSSPKQVGVYKASEFSAWDVYVSNGYAYVADFYSPLLRIIDINNPSSPKEVSNFNTGSVTTGVFIKDNYAYVAADINGLAILDVSNTNNPVLVGRFISDIKIDVSSLGYEEVFVENNYAYLVTQGVFVLDISNPQSPKQLSFNYESSSHPRKIFVYNNYEYIAADYGLNIVDISNPSSPKSSNFYRTGDRTFNVCVSGNYAYVAEGRAGLVVLDISNPALPKEVGYYYNSGKDVFDVKVSGHFAYLLAGTYFLSLDISNPSSPKLANYYVISGEEGRYLLKVTMLMWVQMMVLLFMILVIHFL